MTPRMVTIGAETLTINQWSLRSGTSSKIIHQRLSRNWPKEDLFKPVRKKVHIVSDESPSPAPVISIRAGREKESFIPIADYRNHTVKELFCYLRGGGRKNEDVIDCCVIIEKVKREEFWQTMESHTWYLWNFLKPEDYQELDRLFPDEDLEAAA